MRAFEINITAPKRKSTKVRPVAPLVVKKSKAPTCKHTDQIADQDLGYFICRNCNEIVDQIYINDNKDDKVKQAKMLIWEREYDRNRWKNYGIDYMYGNNNNKLTSMIWYEILQTIPEQFKWYDIYKAFQAAGLLEYWTAFGSYIKFPIPLSRKIMKLVDKYLNHCNTKYRVTYLYLMYKFVQLYGHEGDEKYIPLARSKAWIAKTDTWWKEEVCNKEGIEFKPTAVHTLEWNKKGILKDLDQDMKRRGIKKYTILHKDQDEIVKENNALWLAKYKQYCLIKQSGLKHNAEMNLES